MLHLAGRPQGCAPILFREAAMTSRISRRGMLGVGTGASIALLGHGAGRAAEAEPLPATFTLLLVNDIYKMSETRGRGGFARLATIVKSERARGGPVLFCHAGDCFSPSLMSGFDQGAHIVELTNLVRPDVFVPGNHEFDFGKSAYFQRQGEAKFPFFAANMRLAGGGPVPGHRDSQLYRFGTVNVGVIGVIMEEVAQVSHPEDLQFTSVLAALKTQAEALRAQGADILVAVAHTDRTVDNEIVHSRIVDILLTGHDHDLAITYDGTTVMVESSEEGNFVTAVDITASLEGAGPDRRVTWAPSFRVHDSARVEPDPEVLAIVRGHEGDLARELDVVLGTTLVALDSRAEVLRSQEAAIGDLVADTMRESTGAQLAIVNAGAIRANETYAAGVQLTRRDILSELPFGNTTVLVEMTGVDLRAMLEHGFSQVSDMAGRFPQVSGLKITYKPRATVGQRVVAVQVNGAPLDPNARYKVAANNFMLRGGDGYTMLARGRVLLGATDGKLLANEVMSYIRRLGTVNPAVEGRILALD